MDILNIVFLQNNYFYLLLFLPIFWILFFFSRKSGLKLSITGDLQKIWQKNTKIPFINLFLISRIFIVFVIILANPNIKNTSETIKKNGIDIEILFDISYSMKAEDLQPNRLEIAKTVLQNFISKVSSDRLGLIIFAGKPFTSVPLTFDYQFLVDSVKNITVDSINQNYAYLQGTAIGDAMLVGTKAFSDDKTREKVMIVLTDGEANKGVKPLMAVKLAKEKGVKIYTIGIGGLKDSFVYLDDQFGRKTKIAIGGVDEKTLEAISEITSGKYFRATDNTSLEKIFNELSKLNKTDIEIKKTVLYKPYLEVFEYTLLILIVLLFGLNSIYFLKD
ncbi:MAG: VWA domain-containing protein [Candidatus Gracilibacteria bacterium]|nr:VWA domain-containing protein [Candidatus Gracilibacteria bacterium]